MIRILVSKAFQQTVRRRRLRWHTHGSLQLRPDSRFNAAVLLPRPSSHRYQCRGLSEMSHSHWEDELLYLEDSEGSYDPELWENGYVDYLDFLQTTTRSYAAVQYEVESKTVPQLKDILRERGLKVSGKKYELRERLLSAYNEYTGRTDPLLTGTVRSAAVETSDVEDSSPSDDDVSDEMSLTQIYRPQQVEDPVYCFDTANYYTLVEQHQLESQGRMEDAIRLPEPSEPTVHEAQTLLDLLPREMSGEISESLLPDLMELVLDVGKRPFAWVKSRRHFLGNHLVSQEQLQDIVAPLRFGHDNRAGINGSLHRISAVRNRDGTCIGLTLRVGRYVRGNSLMIADILAGMPHASILVVGDPGSGKTSIIRDAARFLAEENSLLIVDTSCEIGGSGDVPHECIGLSRRMQVKNIESQASVMIECVQNHTPAVMVIDEIGREAEVGAALTCKERGVRMIASAHGNLSGLVRNASLCDLVGGVDIVTVGDAAAQKDAKRRGQNMAGIASKLKAQRRGPPIFDVVVEVKRGHLHEWHVVLNTADAVDSILSNGMYSTQVRLRESAGASTIKIRTIHKSAHAVDEIRKKGIRPKSTLNSIPMGMESSGLEYAACVDAMSVTCRTCPICSRDFSSRDGFLNHVFTKRSCRTALPSELFTVLQEEASRSENKGVRRHARSY